MILFIQAQRLAPSISLNIDSGPSQEIQPLFSCLSFWVVSTFWFLGKFDEKRQAKCHTMKCKAEACFLSEIRANFIAERGEDFFFWSSFLEHPPIHPQATNLDSTYKNFCSAVVSHHIYGYIFHRVTLSSVTSLGASGHLDLRGL